MTVEQIQTLSRMKIAIDSVLTESAWVPMEVRMAARRLVAAIEKAGG